MVGTFYAAPSPDASRRSCKVGDEVTAGETLCIVEAMKLMNEIPAEEMGVVREVCVGRRRRRSSTARCMFYIEPVTDHTQGVGVTCFDKILSRQQGRGCAARRARCPRAGREDRDGLLHRRRRTRCAVADVGRGGLHRARASLPSRYLNIPNIIAAAKNTGAQAIHPGYGFLSENADFARACVDNDLVFIGPSADCIDQHRQQGRCQGDHEEAAACPRCPAPTAAG